MKYQPYLKEAVAAARSAGRILMERRGGQMRVRTKGGNRNNLVTEMDIASEKLIVGRLREAFPEHEILAEEKSYGGASHQFKWIIDPIDGTTNYAHGYPVFCISIALEQAGESVVGVVYNPNTKELFTAIRGRGAFLNGKPVQVSSVRKLRESLLSTGFPPHLDRRLAGHIRHFEKFLRAAHGVRRAGSAAMDLCYVAAGHCEAFYELKLSPWDVAAGALIVREAGGTVTHYDGSPYRIYAGDIVASNGRIHREVLKIVNS